MGFCSPVSQFWIFREEIPMLDAALGWFRAGFVGAWGLLMVVPLPLLAVLPTGSGKVENITTSSVAPPPAPLEPEPEPGISIVILLVYRTLGGLLPAQFQAERRGARYLGGGGRSYFQAPPLSFLQASTQPSTPFLVGK